MAKAKISGCSAVHRSSAPPPLSIWYTWRLALVLEPSQLGLEGCGKPAVAALRARDDHGGRRRRRRISLAVQLVGRVEAPPGHVRRGIDLELIHVGEQLSRRAGSGAQRLL